jgi:galactokinase
MHQTNEFIHQFKSMFKDTPSCFRAPGRINLIGDHTDYNQGFVLPAAVGFYTTVGVSPRHDHRIIVHSVNQNESIEKMLGELTPDDSQYHWSDYVFGVAWALQNEGLTLSGANVLISGNVPLGAGLSSSASLEVACALAFQSLTNQTLDRKQLALVCQQAENQYVGMRCGVMDQIASLFGSSQQALLIDCRDLSITQVPLILEDQSGFKAQIILCNSMVRHELASSEYNQRRLECEQTVLTLKKPFPNIHSLRDVSMTHLANIGPDLNPVAMKRARHVVSENGRVEAAAQALRNQDLVTLGKLMFASHQSLAEDYEVSCEELDALVTFARSQEAVLGARLMGGGFGGCTINLVKAPQVDSFKHAMSEHYKHRFGITPDMFTVEISDGASSIT